MSTEVMLVAGLLIPLILVPVLLGAYLLGRRHGGEAEAEIVNKCLYDMQMAQRQKQAESFQTVVHPFHEPEIK